MRKLLLNSTALATVAAMSAGVAVADVSISGGTEFRFLDRGSNIAANDGTSMKSDSEIKFSFSNKTDSGLSIGYVVEMESDGGSGGEIDESSLSVSGGFGKVVFGQNDNVADNFSYSAQDLIAEEETATVASASISTHTDISDAKDNTKVAYFLPAMGGLTMGVSIEDSGAGTSDTDETAFGAAYTTNTGGADITVKTAMVEKNQSTAGLIDVSKKSMSVKIVSGKISAVLARAHHEETDEDRNSTGFSASYKYSDDITLGAYNFNGEDDADQGEKYSKVGFEVLYTIAAGLSAAVNVDDYKYTAALTPDASGTSTADNGTTTKFTIRAAF
jgi:hypothetical protein